MTGDFATIVDVLDSFFGGTWTSSSIDRLSTDEVDALATDVENYYSAFKMPQRKDGKLRTYSGGATFAMNARAAEMPVTIPESQLLPFAHATTLYVDEIVIDCPLDAWIFSYRDFLRPSPYRGHSGIEIQPLTLVDPYGVGHWNAAEEDQRATIKRAIFRLETLEPAIRAGWVIPVPHLRIWKRHRETLRAQIRRDILNLDLLSTLLKEYSLPPAQSDHVRGLTIMPDEGVIPTDHARAIVESPMIYFDSMLAVADSTDARFLPTADSDYALLLQRVADAGQASLSVRDGLAVGGIKQALLPAFDKFSFATVCDVRRSESAFAEWRNGVRSLVNGGATLDVSSLNRQEEVVAAIIDEHVVEIRAAVAKSQTLSGRWQDVKPDALDIAIATAIWAVPPAAPVAKLLASVAAPLLKRAVLSVVSPTGANNSIVARLDRGRTQANPPGQ